MVLEARLRTAPRLVIACVPVMKSELLSQGIHALIGRDILKRGIFHYNGSGYFSLAW